MIRPLEDKVVVEVPPKEEQKTISGLILAGSKEEKDSQAIVVAVGPGSTFGNGDKMVMDLKVGDKVVFNKYQGTEVNINGKDYIILPYRDIFAVIED